MNTSQKSIVLDDRRITEALAMKDSFRLQRLVDLYRASYDKDSFVGALAVRLMLEHDRRALAVKPEFSGLGDLQAPYRVRRL